MSSLIPVEERSFYPVDIWDEVFSRIRCLQDLKNISLTCKEFYTLSRRHLYKRSVIIVTGYRRCLCYPETKLTSIRNMHIQNLIIDSSQINDADLDVICNMSSLRSFEVRSHRRSSIISSVGLVKLGNLTCLKTLVLDSLSGFVVDDNVLAALSALPNLKHLRMSDILGITAECLFHLRQSSLRVLVLHNCRLTDDSLLAISGILQLEHLSMDENDRVTSIGFQHLKNLSRLKRENLTLSNTDLTLSLT